MSPEILAILGMTATLLIATWTMNRSLRADLHRFEDKVDARFEAFEVKVDARFEAFEVKVDARFDSVHSEIHDLREALHGLDNRMASLEGLMQGLREAIVARSVA